MAGMWWTSPLTHFGEVSTVFRCNLKPSAELVYWATQCSMRQADGTTQAGGFHFGLQTAAALPNSTDTAVNFGGYDTVVGGLATFRGSISPLPAGPGGPPSPLYEWYADRDYYMRVFKSPKQNYVAAELSTDGTQSGDQQVGEIAWRLEVTDMTTMVTTFVRDLLVPLCHATTPMYAPNNWDEDFNNDTLPVATVAWDVRFSEQRVDKRLVTEVALDFPAGFDNTDIGTDRYGFWDRSVVTRVGTQAQLLATPAVSVRSCSVDAVGNDAARTFVTLTVDSETDAGDPLIAFISTDLTRTVTPPTGWTILDTHDASSDVRQTLLWKRHDGSTFTYNFDVGANTNNLAGAMASMYGADAFAAPIVGTAASTTASGTAWSAPAVTERTNYGRVLVGLSASPSNSTARPSYPAGVDERGNTITDNPWWSQAAIAQELVVGQGATAGDAKSGNYVDGSTNRNAGRQVIVPPPLQRARPASDVANTGFADAPLWSKLDEVTPDDGDFIYGATGATCTVSLTAGLTDPGLDYGHVVRYRMRRLDASTASVLVELLQTTTVIASKTETVAAGADFAYGALTLTTTEAAAITDRSALRLRFTATLT